MTTLYVAHWRYDGNLPRAHPWPAADGLPVTTIGDWSLDKRHYMGSYPPRALEPPPKCAGKAAATLTALFNEASGNISDWPVGAPGGSGGVKGRFVLL